jgi:hypothetical protein
MKNLIRQHLKTVIRDLREIRNNKSVPVLLGQGYTIAVKGQISTIQRVGKGFNFVGTWNRGASYWTREVAEKGLAQLDVPLQLEVIHHNDIRDRHEAYALNYIKSFFPHRNAA